jgi:hypothetical protein
MSNNNETNLKWQKFIKVIIQNKCNGHGMYYHEDDWSLKGYGETIEDAIFDAINSTSKEQLIDLDPAYVEVYTLPGIKYDNILLYNEKNMERIYDIGLDTDKLIAELIYNRFNYKRRNIWVYP